MVWGWAKVPNLAKNWLSAEDRVKFFALLQVYRVAAQAICLTVITPYYLISRGSGMGFRISESDFLVTG